MTYKSKYDGGGAYFLGCAYISRGRCMFYGLRGVRHLWFDGDKHLWVDGDNMFPTGLTI